MAAIKLNASKCRNIDRGYTYSLHSAELENTSTIKDLGVIFDPELKVSANTVKKKIKLMQCWGLLRETLYTYQRKLLFYFIRL